MDLRVPFRPLVRSLSSTSASSASLLAGHSPRNSFTSYFFHNKRWTANTSPNVLPSAVASIPFPSSYRKSESLSARRLFRVYAQLAKSRLTVLVVLTAMGGVAVAPLPTTLPVLLSTALGTALCSASANTLNQIQEVPFDAQMARTRNRPLVRRAISPVHATSFAVATGVAGTAVLWTMVNPTTALLGASNIALYAGAYTWLKRKSILNTWVGAVVGALPPLMGWTACEGHIIPSSWYSSLNLFLPSFLSSVPVDASLPYGPLAPLALFMLLFSWQFPHFNSLSHFVRESYAQAGYKMLSVIDPAKNTLVALRHAILLVPISSILIPLAGLTSWTFALTSLPINLVCVHAAWKFWKSGSEKHARRTFQHSLWYLPVMLGLMMFHKRGVDWSSWVGTQAEENAPSDNSVSSNVTTNTA